MSCAVGDSLCHQLLFLQVWEIPPSLNKSSAAAPLSLPSGAGHRSRYPSGALADLCPNFGVRDHHEDRSSAIFKRRQELKVSGSPWPPEDDVLPLLPLARVSPGPLVARERVDHEVFRSRSEHSSLYRRLADCEATATHKSSTEVESHPLVISSGETSAAVQTLRIIFRWRSHQFSLVLPARHLLLPLLASSLCPFPPATS